MLANFWEITVQYLPYILIPLINAVVGWGTNWLALKMTFYPLDFVGIPPYGGWQGIIPSKAKEMAETSVDLLTEKLLDVQELFERIDPTIIAQEMRSEVERLCRQIIDEAMRAQAPLAWKVLPQLGKQEVYKKAYANLPNIVAEMMDDIKADIDNLLDVKKMTVDILIEDKQLLNDIFEECGKEEFKFIEKSGIYFGFMFGLIQSVVWYFVQENSWWADVTLFDWHAGNMQWIILIFFGLLVGLATNMIALKIIFYPLEPVNLGFYKLQGLFIKRQQEVSLVYARIISENILTMPHLFDTLTRGYKSDQLTKLIRKHIDNAVNEGIGSNKTLFELMAGKDRINIAKNIATYRFMEELPVSIRQVFDYAGKALNVEASLGEKMQRLSAHEFEGFLHPVFEADEWKLILVGGFLGAVAGAMQLLMF
ncbi:MAG: uncharacterized membrane protein YheB (UPF0754 family) [Arenicella sp.]|jgi:uncharacterized membrane protein YheB (UPF0754 family)